MRIGVNPEKKEGILGTNTGWKKRQIRVADGGNVPCAEVGGDAGKDLGANRRRTHQVGILNTSFWRRASLMG